MDSCDEFREVLKNEGLKYTKHRASILKFVAESGQPVSAEQVFFELQSKGVKANLSTVYRILDSLAAKGLIVKSSIGSDTKAMFELNRMEHKHHLICMSCKKMMSVDGCPFDEYEKILRKKMGFDVTGHKLEIYGYCKECSLLNEKSPDDRSPK